MSYSTPTLIGFPQERIGDGKVYRNPMPYPRDLKGFKENQKITTIVQLCFDREFSTYGKSETLKLYEEMKFKVIKFPIRDFNVPESKAKTRELVDVIISELKEGKNILIHCVGGNGRTGLLLACLARKVLGLEGKKAVEWVREYVRHAVERPIQEKFVSTYLEDDEEVLDEWELRKRQQAQARSRLCETTSDLRTRREKDSKDGQALQSPFDRLTQSERPPHRKAKPPLTAQSEVLIRIPESSADDSHPTSSTEDSVGDQESVELKQNPEKTQDDLGVGKPPEEELVKKSSAGDSELQLEKSSGMSDAIVLKNQEEEEGGREESEKIESPVSTTTEAKEVPKEFKAESTLLVREADVESTSGQSGSESGTAVEEKASAHHAKRKPKEKKKASPSTPRKASLSSSDGSVEEKKEAKKIATTPPTPIRVMVEEGTREKARAEEVVLQDAPSKRSRRKLFRKSPKRDDGKGCCVIC